ncbi:Scr1 family TA system antitoxin-like transcriptional regulator [Streptomyces sp. NPDC029216]|uniref:Scr1 family TA system antitoxin-like transcriptional regulator n=1 Tax=Streptomyces sp. NPDC029216 TaxID=3154701 RepID=UPI0033C1F472
MPVSPSSSAQAAREALAVRLGHLMRDAGINGRELSRRCGWDKAKTSRILGAKAAPCDADIRAWCTACNAEEQAADLVATARAVESMYMEWRRQHSAGMRRAQEDVLARNAAARTCRAYVSNLIPGFFQTADYAEALMRSVTDFQGTPDDLPEAVAARLARSRFLYEGDHRFVVLIEERVLRTRIGTPATMAGQGGTSCAHARPAPPVPRPGTAFPPRRCSPAQTAATPGSSPGRPRTKSTTAARPCPPPPRALRPPPTCSGGAPRQGRPLHPRKDPSAPVGGLLLPEGGPVGVGRGAGVAGEVVAQGRR